MYANSQFLFIFLFISICSCRVSAFNLFIQAKKGNLGDKILSKNCSYYTSLLMCACLDFRATIFLAIRKVNLLQEFTRFSIPVHVGFVALRDSDDEDGKIYLT